VYDYYIKDHLGNTRVTLTDELQQDNYPAATVELSNSSSMSVQQSYYTMNTNNIIPVSGIASWGNTTNNNYPNNNGNPPVNNNPSENTSATSQYVYALMGGATNDRTGLGITLKVMAGDQVSIYARSFWHNNTSTGNIDNMTNRLANAAITALIGSFAGSAAVTGAAKGATGTALTSSSGTTLGGVNTYLGANGRNITSTSIPQAYLNWILFDEQFRPVASNCGFDGVYATADYVKLHAATVTMSKSGYLYVFCSNESNVPVYFDNLQVLHNHGPLLQTDDYYPFGLTMAGISSKAAGKPENRFKYNGKELQHQEFSDGSGLEEYDYGARMQDPQLGVWHNIDPLAEFYFGNSPYVFALDQPTNAIDPDGGIVIFINGNHFGDGGSASYWRTIYRKWHNSYFPGDVIKSGYYERIYYNFDEKMMDLLGDHNNRDYGHVKIYKDGSLGGWVIPGIAGGDRLAAGYSEGKKEAADLISHLKRDPNNNIVESIKVVAHSMGGMYAKGYILALIEYSKKHPQDCMGLTITEIDIAIFQPTSQTAIPGVKTYQAMNEGDGLNNYTPTSANTSEKGDVDYKKNKGGAHSIFTFDWIFSWLSSEGINSTTDNQSSNASQGRTKFKRPKYGG
jgi:RHS repeat-associated protein